MKPDQVTRTAALRVLNSPMGRDLARMVIRAVHEGRTLEAVDVAGFLLRLGEPEPVAAVVAQSILLRASASVLLAHIEAERTRVQALTPVAHMVIGRLRRR